MISNSFVLLVDGLEALAADKEIHQIFRWLLLRGPARRIWPIVTLDAAHSLDVNPWLESFRTRLCGHITGEKNIQLLTGSTNFFFSRSYRWITIFNARKQGLAAFLAAKFRLGG